jgi:hypothetical protein
MNGNINRIKNGLKAALVCAVIPIMLSACWEDLEDISGKVGGGTKLIIKRVSPGDNIKEVIEKAISEKADVVQVAAGVYQIDTTINISGNIDVLGGYSADFTERDPVSNTTTIQDTRSGIAWLYALVFALDTTNETVFDGLTVYAGDASDHGSAMVLYGSPVISNCSIYGSATGNDNIAIHIRPGADGTVIINNDIFVRSSSHADHGITDNSNNSFIVNNIVRSTGVETRRLISPRGGSGANIFNNLLVSTNASGVSVRAIHIEGGYNAKIINNIMLNQGAIPFYCMYEFGVSGNLNDPAIFQFNNIVGEINYYNDGSLLTTITAINSLLDMVTGYNISVDMISTAYFVNHSSYNYRLSSTCPTSIHQGGQNLTTEFNARGIPAKDKDGNPRPTSGPWSIGPYEKVD